MEMSRNVGQCYEIDGIMCYSMMGTMTMSIHKIQKTKFLLKKLSMGILTSKLSLRPMKSTHAHSSQFSLS